MPSDSTERRVTKPNQMGSPTSEPEKLQCPRCDSTNTKFCYYNNYNFSQPRHFCKSCRRYWTHGGTLRDIPVGGGNRKNAKRSRTHASVSAATSSLSFSSSSAAASFQEYRRVPPATTSQLLAPLSGTDQVGPLSFLGDLKAGANVYGSFTSLLNTHGPGMYALGGTGLGIGAGLEEMGFGLGRAVWPFPEVGMGEVGTAGGGGSTLLGSHWPLESGEVGDCFPFSGFASSTPGVGNGIK